jgi:tetratricopeptide (TPR) repeat protein
VSEEQQGPQSGSEGSTPGVDPVATATALSGASRERADSFLEDQQALIARQGRLVDLQCEYLADKDKFELSHLRWRRFTEQMKGALQFLTAVVGIVFAASLSYMVWDAAHSKGLIIEPFSVPPDLAARGLGGEVVAGQLLDHLTQMQSVTTSSRPAQSYVTNWGNDIKVEIPETGVSIGEFQRFMKQWLGHDTRISGAVWHTASGIAISVRAAGLGSTPILGTESDLDDLIQKAAEQAFGATQPYRYANYLDRNYYRPGAALRIPEAEAIYRRLIYDPDPTERAWAWNGLGTIAYSQHGNQDEAARDYLKALAIDPNLTIAYSALSSDSRYPERSLWAARNYLRLAPAGSIPVAFLLGDYAEYGRRCRLSAESQLTRQVNNRDSFWDCAALGLALQHDGTGSRALFRELPPVETQQGNGRRSANRLEAAAALDDWQTVANMEIAAEAAWIKYLPNWDRKVWITMRIRRLLALAKAHLGDMAGAQAVIGVTPGDCYACLLVRGKIASLARDWGRADYWFSRAAGQAPSIPFAYHDRGRALLERSKPDEAIAQFKLANQKGPHFADPMEGWGEALMAKDESHLALAKFKEAEKYAPNWGRLHLKWGEALVFAGKKDDAKAQFARAAALDLTPSEKSELARMKHV